MKTWAIVAIQMMSSLNMIATQSSSTSHAKRWFSWLSHQSVQILSGRFMGWAWTLATLCGKWEKNEPPDKIPWKIFSQALKWFFSRRWLFSAPRDAERWELAVGWKCLLWVGFIFNRGVSASFPNNRSTASYTCGPYGQFVNSTGSLYTTAVSECLWNKTWSPSQLDPCKA